MKFIPEETTWSKTKIIHEAIKQLQKCQSKQDAEQILKIVWDVAITRKK